VQREEGEGLFPCRERASRARWRRNEDRGKKQKASEEEWMEIK
jgi:hypothetical protein